jgi:hypothetical protein
MWFALATALASASTAGEGSTPSAAVHRILESESPPKLDGELSDAIWQSAGELGPLTQVEPVRGAAPSERTVVKLCYDANNLYLALWCDDSDPAGIRATQMQRDANLDPDDRVEILIDPFLDRRNAFWFQIGAAGSLGDALVTRNGATFNQPWDGIFHGHARSRDGRRRRRLAAWRRRFLEDHAADEARALAQHRLRRDRGRRAPRQLDALSALLSGAT